MFAQLFNRIIALANFTAVQLYTAVPYGFPSSMYYS